METSIIKKHKAYQNAFCAPKPTPEEISRFNQLKSIAKDIKQYGLIDQETENKIQILANEFTATGNKQGMAFSEKVLALYFEKKAKNCIDIDDQIFNLEEAHYHINRAVVISGNHFQPSLPKHQGRIKSLLAVLLHQKGDHHNANLLQADASKILGKLVYEYPEYSEARLEMIAVQVMKLPTTLKRILIELDKAEQLFATTTRTKHISDAFELEEYHSRIEEMRNTASRLLSLIN